MTQYEYKVIPAPSRGLRGKGVKGAEGKFANALETVMNQMGADGWEYQRAETLPSEERAGIASKSTVFRNVLVFRRDLQNDVATFKPKLLDAPTPDLDPEIETADPTDASSDTQIDAHEDVSDPQSEQPSKAD